MNTTKETIEVLQAFERGEEIQCRYVSLRNEWRDAPNPIWNFVDYEYRIKPKEKKKVKMYLYAFMDVVNKWCCSGYYYRDDNHFTEKNCAVCFKRLDDTMIEVEED